MTVTERDRSVVTEISWHQLATTKRLVSLGLFGSIPRCNARLLSLRSAGFLRTVAACPLHSSQEFIYMAGTRAQEIVVPRVASLLRGRSITPRFVDHALAVLDIRIILENRGFSGWLHEQQIRHRYRLRTGPHVAHEDFRPDGLIYSQHHPVFIEADRGNASRSKLAAMIESYRQYDQSGLFESTYKTEQFTLLVVTTGPLRKQHLESLISPSIPFRTVVCTLESLDRSLKAGEISL